LRDLSTQLTYIYICARPGSIAGRQENRRVESFGARLKQERQQRKITLDEIAASTKIGTRFLRALEEERFEQLPGGIFNKGFVRAYARHLGIDEEQAIADYLAAAGPSPVEKKPEDAAQPVVWAEQASSSTARVPWGMFAIALLIVAFGFAIWGFHSQESRQRDQATASPAANRAAPVPASAASTPREQPTMPASPASPAQTPVAAPGAFLVLVKAHGDSWLTITADGKEIMQALLAASAEKAVEARKQIVIKAGSVGALDFSFNGKKLPAQGGYDEVKTLTFDGNGLQPALAKAQSAAQPSPP
jgi:cytoskeleton protein RodZ